MWNFYSVPMSLAHCCNWAPVKWVPLSLSMTNRVIHSTKALQSMQYCGLTWAMSWTCSQKPHRSIHTITVYQYCGENEVTLALSPRFLPNDAYLLGHQGLHLPCGSHFDVYVLHELTSWLPATGSPACIMGWASPGGSYELLGTPRRHCVAAPPVE